MDLISREAAVKIARKYGVETGASLGKHSGIAETIKDEIVELPSVPAVPLDKLCEWLAEHSVIIPCETCRNFSNGYCTAIGDMDKPCPNKAEDWQRAIKEWIGCG